MLRGDAGLAGAAASMSGLEFDELMPAEQQSVMEGLAVFSRVEPSHKTRLVELLKAQVRAAGLPSPCLHDRL